MGPVRLTKIGKYEILDVIGRGGMGVVYKAVDPAIGRLVAIKMITAGFSDDPNLLKRFYREAQSTGTLQHPNIVTVYDLGDDSGTPYMVMEYLEGETLEVIIRSRREMPLAEKLSVMVLACDGLDYAHHRDVVHRDIKPANIIMTKDGGLKIVDFGIARFGNERFTRTGQVMGSIYYMSPEQINGEESDAGSDIYSTGIVLFEFLTGELPFRGKDTTSTLMKILHEPPPPLSTYLRGYPAELDRILRRALAKSRHERYLSIEEFAFDLQRLQEELRRELIGGYLRSAELSIEQSEWSKAKENLRQILKLDRQNTRASELVRGVQSRSRGVDTPGSPPTSSTVKQPSPQIDPSETVAYTRPRTLPRDVTTSRATIRPSGTAATGVRLPRDTQAEQFQQGLSVAPASQRPKANKTVWVVSGAMAAVAAAATLIFVHGPKPVSVHFEVAPNGTTITVAGQQCSSPCDLQLKPGSYQVQGTHEGYVSLNQSVEVKAGSANLQSFTLARITVAMSPMPPPVVTTPSVTTPLPTPAPSPAALPARMQISGARPGSEVLVDGKRIGRIDKRGNLFSNIKAGDHQVKFVANASGPQMKYQHFSAASAVTIDGSEYKAPPVQQPQASDAAEWQQVSNSQDPDQLSQFIRRYPNSVYTPQAESRLEILHWSRAIGADTPSALTDYLARYPHGAHSQTATAELQKVGWLAIAGSKDANALETYLKLYPASQYRNQAWDRLNDVIWEKTNRRDASDLRNYLQQFPSGKHATEANRDLAELANRSQPTASTPPPQNMEAQGSNTRALPAQGQTALSGDVAHLTDGSASNLKQQQLSSSDRLDIERLLTRYADAFERKDLKSIENAWPGIPKEKLSAIKASFRLNPHLRLSSQKFVKDGVRVIVTCEQSFEATIDGKRNYTQKSVTLYVIKRAIGWQIDYIPMND
jgi:serine/threonine protein kinase